MRVPYSTVLARTVPVEGYKTITISEQVFSELERLAKETHRSIPKLIEYLVERANARPEKEA